MVKLIKLVFVSGILLVLTCVFCIQGVAKVGEKAQARMAKWPAGVLVGSPDKDGKVGGSVMLFINATTHYNIRKKFHPNGLQGLSEDARYGSVEVVPVGTQVRVGERIGELTEVYYKESKWYVESQDVK